MLKEGTEARKEIIVTKENTAKVMGSGELEVFATPAMVALMENVAYESVAGQLEEGQGTVGTSMNVKHLSATPVGMKVVCESKLVKVDKRALTFEIKAFDEAGIIGEAIHERFIIENEKFTKKAYSKLEN
ncbi:MAG: thioesterase family protein [Agathobacter sp.]|nr:thioesterase family protein [Agathobacter sp.]